MTQQILRSQIVGFKDFPAEAATHAVEMKEWRAHMRRVAEDQRNNVSQLERHDPFPRPRAHPLVEAAVNENDEADFTIKDDGPSPKELLAARKIDLLNAVSQAEELAKAKAVPPGKRRLYNLEEHRILIDDETRTNEMIDLEIKERQANEPKPAGALARAATATATAFGLQKPVEPKASKTPQERAAEVAAARPGADTEHLQLQQERRELFRRIELVAARAHADIEDLTEQSIDAWQMPTFPE